MSLLIIILTGNFLLEIFIDNVDKYLIQYLYKVKDCLLRSYLLKCFNVFVENT